MSTTARFGLPLISAGQAQKEVCHNEALAVVDAVLHANVADEPLANPPAEPAPGESWLVAEEASGEWAGRDDSLATWTEGGWRFTAPVAGMTVWNRAAGCWLHWSGTDWADGWPVKAVTINGVQIVGQRQPDVPNPSGGTTIDTEARAAIELLIVTLKTHGLID